MSTPQAPAPPEWTLTGKHTHGSDGNLLVGCHIIRNATNYQFTQPDKKTVLATSPGRSRPSGKFTFRPDFNYNGLIGVKIIMDTPVATGKEWKGAWSAKDSPAKHEPVPPTGPKEGDFTAQSGAGFDVDEVASSANA